MAKAVQAVQAYSPRLKLSKPIKIGDVAKFIAGRASLNEGTIINVLMEFQNSIIHYCNMGNPLNLEGLGIFSPGINKDGEVRVNYRPDKTLLFRLKKEEQYIGKVKNKDMIGKTREDYILRWNLEHPDDPIDM